MTTKNPLDVVNQKQPKRTVQEWIERGNRILWGQEPMAGKKYEGQYLAPRFDLEWVWANGSYSIQRREQPATS